MCESGAVMGSSAEPLFEAFLNQHDDQSWRSIISALLPFVHEVDRTATQIWFYFFPLALSKALQQAEDSERLARKLSLDGKYLLKDQIDSSHEFLCGHRYWPLVKAAVSELAASTVPQESLDLATQIRHTASGVASKAGIDASLVVGITAIAFMTLQQIGAEAFRQSPGIPREQSSKSPEQILRQRARDDKQGLLGFLRPDKVFTITFNERAYQHPASDNRRCKRQARILFARSSLRGRGRTHTHSVPLGFMRDLLGRRPCRC